MPVVSKKTARKLRIAAVVLLVLFVLGPLPWLWLNWKLGRELKAELERIKAAGEPLTMLEAAPQPVPDDQNAAALYQQVFRVNFDPEYAASGRGGFDDIPNGSVIADHYLPDGSHEAMAWQVLNDRRVVQRLEILRQASERPHSVFEVRWEDGAATGFPHFAKFREATRWVTAKMLMTAADGDTDGALEWCWVVLRMSEHAAQEPTLIGQLVAIAMQAITSRGAEKVLDEGMPSPAAAEKMIAYVATMDVQGAFKDAMLGERAWGRFFFEQVRDRPREFFEDMGHEPQRELAYLYGTPITRPLLKSDELVFLEVLRQRIEAADLPYREGHSRLRAIERDAVNIPATALITRTILGVFARVTPTRDRAIARLDELRIVLALKVYKQKHGTYPATLTDLESTLSWKLPEDVFSGKPFRYQIRGDGFMLYSLGRDFDDDGGVREEARKYEDGDIVWECAR